ncbi:hypothetical protein DPMN_132213 [Dreissena polymorpha]|uniref:Uncharacterized protein n=1 Tax=Dreissena polymorpha TaxID=45954 RepID=A0A9D4FTE5_DREPO|nr:hypothetical protein DPMN_132213 [Dreissena polymorpha]
MYIQSSVILENNVYERTPATATHAASSTLDADWKAYAGAPWLVMSQCIVEIGRIVIRKVQYQLELNRCRNEEIIVKDNFGWVWPIMGGGPYIVEIDRIVIRHVQYQFEAILGGRDLCGRGAPGMVMAPCIAEIDCIVIKEVQYEFEVNRCRNEDIIVKGNFGWAWPMWAGRPRINCFVIREVQYQFEVNRCTKEEIICGLLWAGRPRVGNGAIHISIRVNRCRNEETIVKDNFGWIDRIAIRDVQYQFEVNRCRNEEIIVK